MTMSARTVRARDRGWAETRAVLRAVRDSRARHATTTSVAITTGLAPPVVSRRLLTATRCGWVERDGPGLPGCPYAYTLTHAGRIIADEQDNTAIKED